MDFGTFLRQARERRGVSLQQIALATKISVRVLEALERNDLSKLPGGVFSRAFVRSYAVEVGLDPDETVREFVKQFAAESMGRPSSSTARTAARDADEEAFQSQQRIAGTLLRLVVVSVPLVAAVIYFTMFRRGPERRPPMPADTGATGPAQGVAPSGGTSVSPSEVSDVANPETLTIELRPQARCWVELRVDGKTALNRQMQAGEREIARALGEITLRIDDAAVMVFAINDRPGRRLGDAGEAVTVTIDKHNFRTFLQ